MAYKNKEQQKEWQKKWFQENKLKCVNRIKENRRKRREWFDELLKTQKCQVCGLDGMLKPWAISFHHLDPSTKEEMVSYMVKEAYSENRIKNEMSKCSVMCANCHRKFHSVENYKHISRSGIRQKRIDYYRNYRTSNGCKLCGEKDYRCLDAHHIDSSKKEWNVGRMAVYSFTIEEMKKELSNCVILCSNCHRNPNLYILLTQYTHT